MHRFRRRDGHVFETRARAACVRVKSVTRPSLVRVYSIIAPTHRVLLDSNRRRAALQLATPMQALRKLVSKPRIDDWTPLSKFYYADEALNSIANELDSFDGRRDPERCNQLVNKLRQAQDRVLHIICERARMQTTVKSNVFSRNARHRFPIGSRARVPRLSSQIQRRAAKR